MPDRGGYPLSWFTQHPAGVKFKDKNSAACPFIPNSYKIVIYKIYKTNLFLLYFKTLKLNCG